MRQGFLAGLIAPLLLIGCDDEFNYNTAHGEAVDGEGIDAVIAVMEGNCVACHGAVGASAGLDLASDLCGTVLDGRLVIEGDSDGSVLFQRIVDTSAPMPPGGMMDESNIEIVRDWIDQGADCSAGEAAGDTGDSGVATGADLYGTRCAACHGDSGQGVSAPAMGAIVPGYDQAGLERVIIEGVGTMPAIGVTVDEAQRVAEYVLDTWGG